MCFDRAKWIEYWQGNYLLILFGDHVGPPSWKCDEEFTHFATNGYDTMSIARNRLQLLSQWKNSQ